MPYNYCVYADLPSDIYDTALELRIKDESVLHWEMSPEDLPHVTLFYGPKIEDDQEEITKFEECDELLGGFVSKYKGKLPSFRVKGVSFFDSNPKFNVVKIDFESEEMTEMQIYLRNNTVNTYQEQYERTKAPSYAMPPVNWCHTTLGYLKKDAPIKEICDKLNVEIKKRFDENERRVTGVRLITAKTNTPIKLW